MCSAWVAPAVMKMSSGFAISPRLRRSQAEISASAPGAHPARVPVLIERQRFRSPYKALTPQEDRELAQVRLPGPKSAFNYGFGALTFGGGAAWRLTHSSSATRVGAPWLLNTYPSQISIS